MITLAADESSWQTVGDIATAIGVLVALAGVIVTLVFTLRSEKLTREGQRLERQQAEASAARSEAAAALTEEYTRRVVDALETIARGPDGSTAPTSEPVPGIPLVKWSMTHYRGDAYQLTNDSSSTARNVAIAAHESMVLRPPEPQTLSPGEALTFYALRTFGTSDSTITVQWNEGDDDGTFTWRYPLPPK